MEEAQQVLDRTWRAEAAVAEALKRWPEDGVPAQPSGWLVTTAWRKTLDGLRRDATGREKLARLQAEPPPAPTRDDRLATIFACCHPDLPQPSQVALTLYAASGLATDEIAAAFLVPTSTMAQRLLRAKRQLRDRGIRFEQPAPDEYAQRLPAVPRSPRRRRCGRPAGVGPGHQPGGTGAARPPPRQRLRRQRLSSDRVIALPALIQAPCRPYSRWPSVGMISSSATHRATLLG